MKTLEAQLASILETKIRETAERSEMHYMLPMAEAEIVDFVLDKLREFRPDVAALLDGERLFTVTKLAVREQAAATAYANAPNVPKLVQQAQSRAAEIIAATISERFWDSHLAPWEVANRAARMARDTFPAQPIVESAPGLTTGANRAMLAAGPPAPTEKTEMPRKR